MAERKRGAYIYAISAILLWSTVATAFKVALEYLSPEELLLYSSIVSFVTFYLIISIRGRMDEAFSLFREKPISIVAISLLNPLSYYLLLFHAYDTLPAQSALAINYTWGIVLPFLSVPLLGHRLGVSDIVGAILCYLAVLVVATGGDPLSLKFDSPQGVLCALGSTLSWSIYWIALVKFGKSSEVVLLCSFAIAIPLMILYMVIADIPVSLPDIRGTLSAVYVGLFEMGITFVLWGEALRRTDSVSTISTLIYMTPILSLFFIHSIVGEKIGFSTILAIFMILAGLYISKRYKY